MRASFIILVVIVAVCYKVFYFPIPDEIDQKLKFRVLLIGNSLLRALCSFIGQLTGKPSPQVMNELLKLVIPTPPSRVDGSNIEANFVSFDGIRVLLYAPIHKAAGNKPTAGLLFFHGGGYMFGSPELYDELTRKIAEDVNIVVASVDYRLSTQQPFPAAHEDAVAATRYFLNHASEFGVDPGRVGVSGDSAGGHLAAAVAQELTDDHTLPPLKLQVLMYPMLQLLDMHTPSYQRHHVDFGGRGAIISRGSMSMFRSYYLLGHYDDDLVNAMSRNNHTSLAFKRANPDYYDHKLVSAFFKNHPSYEGPVMDGGDDSVWKKHKHLLLDVRTTPLLRKDLSGLPPAYVLGCMFDMLRDDSIMYVARLREAGVEVESVNYYNGWHGMLNFPNFFAGERSLRLIITYLKMNL